MATFTWKHPKSGKGFTEGFAAPKNINFGWAEGKEPPKKEYIPTSHQQEAELDIRAFDLLQLRKQY